MRRVRRAEPGGDVTVSCALLPATDHQQVSSLFLEANSLADYAVFAPGLARSRFRAVTANGALKVGMLLGYGWDNRVEDCRISSNAVGLEIFNAANNVNVLNTMIVQNLGIGLHLHGGQQVNVEGNSFDGNGGPGLFVVGEAALTVQSNYFEASCGAAR